MSSRPRRERHAPPKFSPSSRHSTIQPRGSPLNSARKRLSKSPAEQQPGQKRRKVVVSSVHKRGRFSALISNTVWETFVQICQAYSERPALGTRDEGEQASYTWMTYSELLSRVEAFGSGLLALLPSGCAVGICAPNVADWIVADWACVRAGLLSVPIHMNRAHDVEGLRRICEETCLRALVCSPDVRGCFTFENSGIQLIIEINSTACETWENGCKILSFDRVLQDGRRKKLEDTGATNPPEKMITLFFSSGTTGRPKAVGVTEREFLDDMREVAEEEDAGTAPPPVQLAIYSFAYSLERDNSQTVFLLGGQLALFNQNLNRVFDQLWDMQPRPTTILGVPALWSALFQRFEVEVESSVRCAGLSYSEARTQARQDFVRRFGEQLQVVSSGTAPLTPTVRRFMQEMFPAAFIGEGYGLQETGLITLENVIQPGVQVRLRDLPDMGYTSADRPWPRGEICVKTPSLISSYVLQPEGADGKSLAFIRGGRLDGYFATGDVGEMRRGSAVQQRRRKGKRRTGDAESASTLYVIDRVKSLFKLSNGEYVSPVALEHIYSTSPLVHQIMIYGKAWDDHVVAVVVPDMEQTALRAPHLRAPSSSADDVQRLCHLHRKELETVLLDDLQSLARFHGLRAHERVQHVHIATPMANPSQASEGIGWSALNGALTPSLKLNRAHIAADFREELSANRHLSDGQQGREEALRRLLPADMSDAAMLSEVGMDSLSAFRHANALQVPLELLLSPQTTVGAVREAARGCSGAAIARLVGDEALVRRDLAGAVREMSGAADAGACAVQQAGVDRLAFFITGATGFLGSVLVLEMLAAYPQSKAICLVRCEDGSVDTGRRRLLAALRRTGLCDAGLEARVEVVAGSLGEDLMGIPQREWEQLAARRPVVVHSAAHVSWVQPYSALRKSNVLGTREVLRLCLHPSPPLKLVHISTGAAAAHLLPTPPADAGPASSTSLPPLPAGLLSEFSGYVVSKMVAEALVRWAVRQRGLSAVVFRPGAVAPHTTTGYSNPQDFVCRYIATCRQLKLCADAPALCELIPVDFVAKAVVVAGVRPLLKRKNSHACADDEPLSIANAASPTFTELGRLMRKSGVADLQMCQPREFARAVRAADACALQPLQHLLESDEFWTPTADIDPCLALQELLRDAEALPSRRKKRLPTAEPLRIPGIGVEYLHRMFARL